MAEPLRQKAREMWPEPDPVAPQAEARGRASSLPQHASLPLPPPRVAVTDSDPYRRAGGLLSALADGRHVTGRHPSLAMAREAHHEAADQWNTLLLRSGRLAWGYGIHLPVKAALMLIEWVFETPLRFFAVVIVAALAYYLVIR